MPDFNSINLNNQNVLQNLKLKNMMMNNSSSQTMQSYQSSQNLQGGQNLQNGQNAQNNFLNAFQNNLNNSTNTSFSNVQSSNLTSVQNNFQNTVNGNNSLASTFQEAASKLQNKSLIYSFETAEMENQTVLKYLQNLNFEMNKFCYNYNFDNIKIKKSYISIIQDLLKEFNLI